MKLFETILDLLVSKDKKLLLGDDRIYAIKGSDKVRYYHNFECHENGYCSEQHYPTRTEIEEWLAWIILNNDPRVAILIEFLNSNLTGAKNPLSRGALQEVLAKDHPDIIKRIQIYSDEDLKNAAMELVIKTLKRGGAGLGRGDKETYENLKYEGGIFVFEEGDSLCSEPEHIEKFETEETFKTFMRREGWIKIKNGMVTGRGNPTSFIPFWLESEGVGSLREYIIKNKTASP